MSAFVWCEMFARLLGYESYSLCIINLKYLRNFGNDKSRKHTSGLNCSLSTSSSFSLFLLLLSTIFFYWWGDSHVEIIKGNKTWKLFSFVRIASLTSLIALGLRLNTNYENYLNCFGSCQTHLFQDKILFLSNLLISILYFNDKWKMYLISSILSISRFKYS